MKPWTRSRRSTVSGIQIKLVCNWMERSPLVYFRSFELTASGGVELYIPGAAESCTVLVQRFSPTMMFR